MNVAAAIRHAQLNGTRAISPLSIPWRARRRRVRLRRSLLWVVGVLVGVFIIATLIWGLAERESR